MTVKLFYIECVYKVLCAASCNTKFVCGKFIRLHVAAMEVQCCNAEKTHFLPSLAAAGRNMAAYAASKYALQVKTPHLFQNYLTLRQDPP